MKKNPISAIAGWKSAALLALVAMVAAVAFSGVLSTTQNADAQTASDVSATIEQGDSETVMVTLPGTWQAAPTTSNTITGTTISAAHDATTNVATVSIAIDDRTSPPAVTTTPTVLTFTGNEAAAGNATKTATVGVTVIPRVGHPGTVVTIAAPVGASGASSTLYSIHPDSTAKGSLTDNPGRSFVNCSDDGTDTSATDLLAATATGCDRFQNTGIMLRITIAADSPRGSIYVRRGTDVEGERVITVEPAPVATGLAISPPALGLSQSNTADAESVTITVTNNRGLPVADQVVQVSTTLGQFTNTECPNLPVCRLTTGANGTVTATLRGDNRSGAATVTASVGTLTRTASATFFGLPASLDAAAASGAATVDQGKSAFVILSVADKDGNPVEGSSPGSSVTTEVENPVVVTLDSTAEYEGTASPADNVQACSSGTNAAGKCAVQVSAAANASRGIHTLAAALPVNIPGVGPTVLAASIDIRVVGPPASIETDAPTQSSPSTEIPISVSVYDDAGDLVGAGEVQVILVQGRGAILGAADGKVTLVNGTGSFSYYATSNDDVVAFRLSTGVPPVVKIQEITIGATPVEEPEGPPATWNNELVSGQNLVVWNGEDGADPSAGSDMGVSGIWSYNTGSGTWDGYFPNAADVPGGNTLTSLSNGDAYFVIVE